MTFENYWSTILKHWKLIGSCFLIAGLGAFIVSKLMTPLYQADAVVQVSVRSSSSQADYNNLLASDQLVQTESQLATGTSVLREVASHYPGLTVDTLSKEVTSAPTLNTQLFTITVLDPSPSRAAALANDIATTLIKQQAQVVQADNQHALQQIQQDLDSTQQQMNSIANRIAALQANGASPSQISVLQAKLNALQQHYNQWQTLLAQLELSQAQSGDFLRLAQMAQPQSHPVRPVVLLNTGAGLAAGLFLGLLLALLFEQLDTRVRTAEDVTRLFGWSVLGTVWRSRQAEKERKALINPHERDANVEAYRILRTNVGFSSLDKPLHTIMLTSAMPGDGKSTIAANLAIFLAKAGKSTLLIDADLRRPTQHQIFNLSADRKGLSNAVLALSMPGAASQVGAQFLSPGTPGLLSGAHQQFSLEPYVHNVGIPNLWVMPSGPLPPNPSELLDSKAMKRFFSILEGCGIEMVIFDAPPIRGISDANILASKVDGTLVVIDISRANRKALAQVKTQLAQVGANILGCIVNKQRRSRSDSAYSYYYYYRQEDGHDANRQVEAVPASGAGSVLMADHTRGGRP
ncbi:MAG TPA: Wzz/FepE/Etk N-terminal domain-containing protein [Ktedonobacteraceae bacterium]|jgi:non-specific protein-tyrosine kinase|nr:Wzz/FepE/Etk N-terminal domain-containing protein [Ktedonobacteraceae bacterium]